MEPAEDLGQPPNGFGLGLRDNAGQIGVEPPCTPALEARDHSLGRMPVLVYTYPELSCCLEKLCY